MPNKLFLSHAALGTEMLHPMLHQSKLQISLGLAADTPLDLKSWGYGGTPPVMTSLMSSSA